MSYRVKLTGVTCTDKVSGYNAVVAQDFSTVNCGEYIHVSTLNAEVRHYVCILKITQVSFIDTIWNFTWNIQNIKWHGALFSPRVRLTAVSWRAALAK